MAFERYHSAAKRGQLDILKECSKKDANVTDENGMTPVLWAAFEGQLEALRVLVGKGGDPNKADIYGNTALHLASARGHFSCVVFLVKFGCNLYYVDVDNHSAKDLAAINNHNEILNYLDAALTHLEMTDRKQVRSLKENAARQLEKRMKEKNSSDIQRKGNILQKWKSKIWVSSHPDKKLQCELQEAKKRYRYLVGMEKIVDKEIGDQSIISNSDFDIVEQNANPSVKFYQELQRDSGTMYISRPGSNLESMHNSNKLNDMYCHANNFEDYEFCNLSPHQSIIQRSKSNPNFLLNNLFSQEINFINDDKRFQLSESTSKRTASKVKNTSNLLTTHSDHSDRSSSTESNGINYHKTNQPSSNTKRCSKLSETDSEDDESNIASPDGLRSLQMFLIAWNLEEYLKLLQEQQICDLNTLSLLTEKDLRSLNLALGPYRRLFVAIQERKCAFKTPGIVIDTRL